MSDPTPGGTADELLRLRVFAYTVESHAPVYRAAMRVFTEGKARFRIHYRPDQVAVEIERRGLSLELPEGGLERALDQLVQWGNLRKIHDTGRVSTLEDFRRRHFLYQVTPAGEAAERAVGAVVDVLRESGSLQTVMLGAISRNLALLAAELRRGTEEGGLDLAPRPGVLFETLFNVTEQFRALTENASIFLGRLHEAIDASDVRRDAFVAYKEAVISYLEDFMTELSEITPRITRTLGEFGEAEAERLVTLAAEADAAPALHGERDVAGRLRRQFRDVAAWFLGEPGRPPTVDLLRGAARGAIRRILMVLDRIHEKRFRRANRAADLQRLAAWFEDEDRVEDVHGLFQDAFGLLPARHLGALDDDARPLLPAESWAEAPPVEIAPALRESGRRTTAGRAPKIVDHGASRRRLREEHRRRSERRAHALERFAGRGPLRLGELPLLTGEELDLLLELLDRLLTAAPDVGGVRSARSRDGRLGLLLEEPPGEETAVVRAARGRLRLPDYTLTVDEGVPSGRRAQALRPYTAASGRHGAPLAASEDRESSP